MLKYFRNSLITTSVLYTLLGLVLIAAPGKAIRWACFLIGAVTLWYGISRIMAYRKSGMEYGQRFDLFIGVALIVLGAFLLVSPRFVASMIPAALGLYILVDSVSAIKRALDMKALGFEKWWGSFISALVLAMFGAVMVLNPFGTLEALIRFVGVGFVFDGVSTLVNTILADRLYRG